MDIAWKPFTEPDPESDLLGVVGKIRPDRYRTVPRILLSTRRIEAQLADSHGLIGYTLRAEVLRRRFWAVSVWDGAESLRNFVETNPHAEIRAALKPALEVGRFRTFEVTSDEVPISVDEAIARVDRN